MTVLFITFFIGTVFIIVGIKFNSNYKYLQKHGVRTEARVRGYTESKSGSTKIFYPIISYYDQEKNIYEEELSFGFSYKPWHKGEKFEVLYARDDPSNVTQAKQSILSLGPMLFIYIGVGVLILGLLSYLEVL